MGPGHVVRSVLLAAVIALQAGCATTTVRTSGTASQQPACAEGTDKPSAALYWMPRWRIDQKEPQLREAAARRGVERFVAQQGCWTVVHVERLSSDSGPPTNDELLTRPVGVGASPDLVVLVVVRELGPRLVLGFPVLVEGGTEVVIDLRVVSRSTAAVLQDSRTQWRHGGAFVVKGVGSLDADLSAALIAAVARQAPASRRTN